MLKLVVLSLFVYLASGFITVDDDIVNEGATILYEDCHSLFLAGSRTPGIYRLSDLDLASCDFDKTNGYTVFLRRIDAAGKFTRNTKAYERGFGNFRRSFWWGLKRINRETIKKNNTILRVEFTDWNNKVFRVNYNMFLVGEAPRYRMSVNAFSGPPGVRDALSANNDQEFFTIDHDDKFNCARDTRAGWWFKSSDCSEALPTGNYYPNGHYDKTRAQYDGIYWLTKDHGKDYSMKTFTMSLTRK